MASTYLDNNANELKLLEESCASQQQRHLLKMFPEEIWLNILDRIKCPKDLENLSNASLVFRRLLASKATTFLFPNVYKILASKYIKNYSELCVITGNCRLTCASWNDSIQDLFINSQGAPVHPNSGSYDMIAKMITTTFPTNTRSGINEFIQHFENTHYSNLWKNPFLGRCVIFNDTLFQPGLNAKSSDFLIQFWREISNILTKYGSHIWYCTFHLEDKFSSRQEYYFRMCEWLDLMPNLKGLSVIYYANARNKKYSTVLLERVVMECPLSKLRQLEWLSVDNLPDPILNELVQRNKHITKLLINGNPVSLLKQDV